MFTIYQVRCNADMTEGRGPMRPVTAFSTEEDAWVFANKQSGVMGRKPKGDWRTYRGGKDWDVVPVRVNESMEESTKEYQEGVKKKALAKLTDEERQVLGL